MALPASGASAASASVEQGLEPLGLRRATSAAGAPRAIAARSAAHRRLDLGDEAAVAGAEQRLDRLEAVEIGGQRQLAGPVAVAARDRRRGSGASRSRATASDLRAAAAAISASGWARR